MANCVLGWPIYSDTGVLYTPALSGGSWSADLPLTNLKDRNLDTVARSSNALTASTQFSIDLGASRASRVLSLWKHNLSGTGMVRARAYTALPVAVKLDFVGATDIGTPTRVAASYNSNGCILDKMGDDAAGTAEGSKWVAGWTADATKIIEFEIRKDTATSSVIRVRDTTAGANRLLAAVTWSGTVAVVTMTTGTLISSTLIEDGVYRVVVLTTSVTAASNNEIEFYPATDAALAVAATGTVYAGNFAWFNAATDQLLYDSLFSAGYPSGLTAEDVDGMNLGWVHVTDEAETARYWFFNIWDTGNADGYVQAARLVIAKGWQPTVGMADGAEIAIEDMTLVAVADGGARRFDEKPTQRAMRFVLPEETESEALIQGFDLQRIAGTSGQLFVVYDPDDTTHMHRRAMPCTISRLAPFQHVVMRYHSAWELTEEL